MKLIHVVPITRGVYQGQLSYFSNKDVQEGALVTISVRNKKVPGIVISTEHVRDVKSKIKEASFAVKKIDSFSARQLFLPAFIRAAQKTANYFASETGAVLFHLISSAVILNRDTLLTPTLHLDTPSATRNERLIMEANLENRLFHYKSLIREEFARKKSVYLCVSTIYEAEQISSELQKGIEDYVVVLHSSVSKKELIKRYNQATTEEHPLLIVATGGFFSLPRNDFSTIIIERENTRGFKSLSRPFIDIRTFALFFAAEIGARIILADQPLSIDSRFKAEQGEFDEFTRSRFQSDIEADQVIIDMRSDTVKGLETKDEVQIPTQVETKKKFAALSTDLVQLLSEAGKRDERSFLFNVRRGIAPNTVCEDCGSTVMCHVCDAPTVLHKSQDGNVFVCHKCGSNRSAKERCVHCNSWKLKPLGIGIERIREELTRTFPDRPLFLIDSDNTKTHKQASAIAQAFYTTDGAILVGTEMVLPYLRKPIPYTAIVSVDSLLSLPDPRVHERVFYLLLQIREKALNTFLLQTRQPELLIIDYVLHGNLRDFYRAEIEGRKKFKYPPYTILIKLTAIGTRLRAAEEMEELLKQFTEYGLHIYPSFVPVTKGKYSLNGLIRIPKDAWPDLKLVSILRALPPHIVVQVDPESTL